MIGRDQSAIPRAAAAEHGQSEHARLVAETGAFHNWKWKTPQTRIRDAPNRQSNAPEAPNTKIQAPKKQQYSNIKSRGPALGACCLVLLWSLVLGIWSLLKQSRDLCVGQRQDLYFLRAVIKGAEGANFLEPSHPVEGVEKFGVARRQLGRFKITASEVGRLKRARIFGREKMKAEPAS